MTAKGLSAAARLHALVASEPQKVKGHEVHSLGAARELHMRAGGPVGRGGVSAALEWASRALCLPDKHGRLGRALRRRQRRDQRLRLPLRAQRVDLLHEAINGRGESWL